MTCLVYGRTYQLDCTRTEAPFLRDEPLPRRLETAGRCLLRVPWPLAAGRGRPVAGDRDAARVGPPGLFRAALLPGVALAGGGARRLPPARVAPRVLCRAALVPGIALAGGVARRFHRTRDGGDRIRRPARRQPRRVFV